MQLRSRLSFMCALNDFFFLITTLTIIACNSTGSNAGPSINYHLDRVYTGQLTNNLNIEVPRNSDYFFSLDGSGFEAEVPLGVKLPIQNHVTFTANHEGIFFVNLKIYHKDGFLLIDEHLSWEYSTAKPSNPIISFPQKGTPLTSVNLLLSAANLASKTSEYWIEGDITNFQAEGSWNTIPKDLNIPLILTESDENKTVRVKFRNIYGNESDLVSASIEKKSTSPTNCKVILNGSSTFYSSSIRALMTADNADDLYWIATGDITNPNSLNHVDGTTHEVGMTTASDSGLQNFAITLQDIAGNTCESTFAFEINIDPTYAPYGLTLNDGTPWTDAQDITLTPKYDRLPNDVIEMKISGDLEPSDKVGDWIAFTDSVPVSLSALRGNRNVYIQYRTSPTDESLISTAQIFLNLSFLYSGNTLNIDHPAGLKSVSIEGCTESYNAVDYASSYICHQNGPSIQVTYYFENGLSHAVTK